MTSLADEFIIGAKVGVVFEINIVNTTNNMFHPFVDITRFSSRPSEEEILFFAGAVFHIDSVEKKDDSTWLTKLTLSNEIVDQLEQIMNGVKEHLTSIICWDDLSMKICDLRLISKYNTILTQRPFSWKDLMTNVFRIKFSDLNSTLGNSRKVIEYYEKLLHDESFINHSKSIMLHIMIGYNYSYLLEYENALLHYGIALSSLDDTNSLTGRLYIYIGDVWRGRDSSEIALSCYEKALEIIIHSNINDQDVAVICRKMSDIYLEQNNYEAAAIYKQQADLADEPRRQRSEFDIETSLKYFQDQLNTQVDLSPLRRADILYGIGICFMTKSDYSQASENLLQAKELFENHLPSYDEFVEKFSRLFSTIALIHLLLKQNFEALIMLKKVVDIYSSFMHNFIP